MLWTRIDQAAKEARRLTRLTGEEWRLLQVRQGGQTLGYEVLPERWLDSHIRQWQRLGKEARLIAHAALER